MDESRPNTKPLIADFNGSLLNKHKPDQMSEPPTKERPLYGKAF
jgi:hypothetical protein